MSCEPVRGTIPGPAGELEVWQACPKGEARGAMLIAHPHPLHGGSMDNKVVYTLAKSALRSGLVAVRFNFRGVGASGGRHDNGVGEQDDLLAVADWMATELSELPLYLAGFSFGSRIALLTTGRAAASGLIMVAPPLRLYSDIWPIDRVALPWAVLMGDADEVVSYADVEQWVEKQQLPPRFQVFPGADHFFHGRLVELGKTVDQILDS